MASKPNFFREAFFLSNASQSNPGYFWSFRSSLVDSAKSTEEELPLLAVGAVLPIEKAVEVHTQHAVASNQTIIARDTALLEEQEDDMVQRTMLDRDSRSSRVRGSTVWEKVMRSSGDRSVGPGEKPTKRNKPLQNSNSFLLHNSPGTNVSRRQPQVTLTLLMPPLWHGRQRLRYKTL